MLCYKTHTNVIKMNFKKEHPGKWTKELEEFEALKNRDAKPMYN